MLALPYQGGSVSAPVHLFSVTGKYAAAPVLIYSGGVDTYKMDLHAVCLTLAQRLGRQRAELALRYARYHR
jgi:esterase FrsA